MKEFKIKRYDHARVQKRKQGTRAAVVTALMGVAALAVGWFAITACLEEDGEEDALSRVLRHLEPLVLATLALTLSMGSFVAMAAGILVLLAEKKRRASWREVFDYGCQVLAKASLCFAAGILMYFTARQTRIPWFCLFLLAWLLALAAAGAGAQLGAIGRVVMGLVGAEAHHLSVLHQGLVEALGTAVGPAAAGDPLPFQLRFFARLAQRLLLVEAGTARGSERGGAHGGQARPLQQAAARDGRRRGQLGRFHVLHNHLLLSIRPPRFAIAGAIAPDGESLSAGIPHIRSAFCRCGSPVLLLKYGAGPY